MTTSVDKCPRFTIIYIYIKGLLSDSKMRKTCQNSTKSLWKFLNHAVCVCLIMDVNVYGAPTNSILTTQITAGATIEPSILDSLSVLYESVTHSETYPLTNTESVFSTESGTHKEDVFNTVQTLESGTDTYFLANTHFPEETSTAFFTASHTSPTLGDSTDNRNSKATSYMKCSDVLRSFQAAENANEGEPLHTGIASTDTGWSSESDTGSGTLGYNPSDLVQALTSMSFTFAIDVSDTLTSSTSGFDGYQSLPDSLTPWHIISTSNIQVHSDSISWQAVTPSSTSHGVTSSLIMDPLLILGTECSDCHDVHISSSSFVQSTRPVYYHTVSSRSEDVKSDTSQLDIRPSSTLVYLKISGSTLLCETSESHTMVTSSTLQPSRTEEKYTTYKPATSFSDNTMSPESRNTSEMFSETTSVSRLASDTQLGMSVTTESVNTNVGSSVLEGTMDNGGNFRTASGHVTTDTSISNSSVASHTAIHGDNINTTSDSSSSNGDNTAPTTSSSTGKTAQEPLPVMGGTSLGSQSPGVSISGGSGGSSSGVGSTNPSVTEPLSGSNGSTRGQDPTVTRSQPMNSTTNTPTSTQRLPQSVLLGLVFGVAFCVALIIMCVCFWKFCCNGPGITPHLYKYKAQTLRVAPVSPPPTHKPKLIFVAD